MKLATFKVPTHQGPMSRLGIVLADSELLIDANAAFRVMCSKQGKGDPWRRAQALCPPNMVEYAQIHGTDVSLLHEIQRWANRHPMTPAENTLVQMPVGYIYKLAEVKLGSPVDRVPVLRDFAAFEDHLQSTFGKMGIRIPPAWYDYPMAFKGNSTALAGPDDEIVWPAYTDKLDFELEIAAIIGQAGCNISVHDAERHILGYTLLNDFSARDIQAKEMSNSTGPFKAKDFAWSLGPFLVTPDELGDPRAVRMSVRINGETWTESTPGEMKWSFAEAIAYTSQSERLNVGDVFGSGTVNGGCGFELERWIGPSDVVELVAERIGVLRNRISAEKEAAVQWRQSSACSEVTR